MLASRGYTAPAKFSLSSGHLSKSSSHVSMSPILLVRRGRGMSYAKLCKLGPSYVVVMDVMTFARMRTQEGPVNDVCGWCNAVGSDLVER